MTKTDGRFWMHRVKHARRPVAAFLLGVGKLVDGNENLDGNWGVKRLLLEAAAEYG
jgi:hypothetical protein